MAQTLEQLNAARNANQQGARAVTKDAQAEQLANILKAAQANPELLAALRETLGVQRAAQPFVLKVSEKGCLQMRGVPGAPVAFGITLYVEAVEFILDHADAIRAFVKANNAKLSRKNRG